MMQYSRAGIYDQIKGFKIKKRPSKDQKKKIDWVNVFFIILLIIVLIFFMIDKIQNNAQP